jgi:hypothetical protein
MTYEEFLEFIPSKCMYETIYDDGNGHPILVIRVLDAYGMVNKATIKEAEVDPVAWADHGVVNWIAGRQFMHEAALYERPPQRTWVGLTDEEIAECAERMEASDPTDSFWREFAQAIEAKIKEKNT